MTTESELERGLAMGYMNVLLGSSKVVVWFEGWMGFGRVPAKTVDFESGKPEKKERCIELLEHQKRACELLLEEIGNREDETRAATVDPEQTDIEDALESPPAQAVIVWHPETKDLQRETVAVTTIDENIYLVRHLENGSHETLFQGTSWEDLVQQVLARKHRLEPMPSAEAPGGSDPETAATGPHAPGAATAPASAAAN